MKPFVCVSVANSPHVPEQCGEYVDWIIKVDSLDSITNANHDHAYLLPDNTLWILDYDKREFIKINNQFWKDPVLSFSDLGVAYPEPEIGWTALVLNETAIYYYDGEQWTEADKERFLIGYGECTVSSSNNRKYTYIEGFELRTGVIVGIRFQNKSDADFPHLNVNGFTEQPIYYKDTYITSGMITKGMTALFQYNGEQWILLNPAVPENYMGIHFSDSYIGEEATVYEHGIIIFTGMVQSWGGIELYNVEPGTQYTVTCDGDTKTFVTDPWYGQYTFYLDRLSDHDWSDISQIAGRGEAEKRWSIGDEKDITLTTGETLTFQIYDFNHDDLSGEYGKAPITFGMKNLMSDEHKMNNTYTSDGGFIGSDLYAWLTTDLWNSLPYDLKAIIKPVLKRTSEGGGSSTIVSDIMSLFLFSEAECIEVYWYPASGEGRKYPIFTDDNSRIKEMSNGIGEPSFWWFRSPDVSTSYGFRGMSQYGRVGYNSASIPSGVCFGFCI